jgi:uncharacterized protein
VTHRQSQRWTLSGAGLLLALGFGVLPLSHWGEAYSSLGPPWGSEVLWWVAGLVVLVYVIAVERRPLNSIGFRVPAWRDIGWGLTFGIALLVGAGVLEGVVYPALHLKINAATYEAIIGAPLTYRTALVTRAAVCEEILFRAYPLERLQEWSGSPVLAGFVTWFVFTCAHLTSWGAAQLIVAGFGGALLTVLYVWRRNIWSNMLAHWIADSSFVLLPLVSAHR